MNSFTGGDALKANRNLRRNRRRSADYQRLEPKRCLASVGWDGMGQGSAELTYFLGDSPDSIEQSVFEDTIEEALDVWADIADITFTETETPGLSDSLDITSRNIDGTGGTLAFAYLPDDVNRQIVAGDVQFDSSENWEVGNKQGSAAFDLLYVAVHELGHALGLEHNDIQGSVMNDSVSPNQSFVALGQSDVEAVLDLYAPFDMTSDDPDEPTDSVDPSPGPSDPIDEPSDEDKFNPRNFWFFRRLTQRFRQAEFQRFDVDRIAEHCTDPSAENSSALEPQRGSRFVPARFRFF